MSTFRAYVASVIVVIAIPCGVLAADRIPESRYGVDMPTAGVLHARQYAMDVQMSRGGNVAMTLGVGVFNGLMIGVGFGGSGIIGTGDVFWQKLPSAMVRWRLIDEALLFPALALGFESQGNEGWNSGGERFTVKSPGVYASASKYFSWLGFFGLHGCLNYSLEQASDEKLNDGRFLNFAISAEKSIGAEVVATAEYNAGWNDHNVQHFGRDRGYLNIGVRWYTGGGLALELDVKDIMGNQDGISGAARVVRISYMPGT
jgi:hypothetical protein